ncbi:MULTISPECIES: RimK/LysX family protein [Vibrio]|uniref:ATP-dependent zinc protease n=2 Tax=Vibrio TaxID=662 RepID=A0A241TBS0_9VIBR|nr:MULTISPECIES: RimK/LysX family protein [Vibrio]ASI92671.1 ribosomal protein S6 modification protein [Vibrio mediterranei]AYV24705.1 ATP-dependent zinc protease [Vibrio mediterranei]KFA97921.1 ribosomal protein S6 modification protein [Vibrio sp. ER1A]MCF4175898.1 RimK/LysX family protein [Vibrio sp. McD22-P3]MCG9657002.1 RimK/LysX family protein [Vibrio mediterranei]
MPNTYNDRMIIGNLEVCSLPELGIFDLEVRIDTGAKTSSLHVDNLERFKRDGRMYVQYDLHPDIYHLEEIVHCESLIHDSRRIKSSNGDSEQRCVIQTLFRLGDREWPIEITLSNRQDMSYMMLLGREAMADKVYVDPSRAFLID